MKVGMLFHCILAFGSSRYEASVEENRFLGGGAIVAESIGIHTTNTIVKRC